MTEMLFEGVYCVWYNKIQQGITLKGRNSTGPPAAVGVGRPTARGSVTDDDRRQTPIDANEQNNTDPLGGPVITEGSKL